MNRIQLCLGLAVGVALLALLFAYSAHVKAKKEVKKNHLLTSQLDIREKQLLRSIFCDGIRINLKQKLVSDQGKVLEFSELIEGKVLVFKFSYRDCDNCIKDQLGLLQANLNLAKDNWKMILVYEFLSSSEFLIRAKEIRLKFGIALWGSEAFAIEESCFFITDKEAVVSGLFIPDVNDLTFTKTYLELLRPKLEPF